MRGREIEQPRPASAERTARRRVLPLRRDEHRSERGLAEQGFERVDPDALPSMGTGRQRAPARTNASQARRAPSASTATVSPGDAAPAQPGPAPSGCRGSRRCAPDRRRSPGCCSASVTAPRAAGDGPGGRRSPGRRGSAAAPGDTPARAPRPEAVADRARRSPLPGAPVDHPRWAVPARVRAGSRCRRPAARHLAPRLQAGREVRGDPARHRAAFAGSGDHPALDLELVVGATSRCSGSPPAARPACGSRGADRRGGSGPGGSPSSARGRSGGRPDPCSGDRGTAMGSTRPRSVPGVGVRRRSLPRGHAAAALRLRG